MLDFGEWQPNDAVGTNHLLHRRLKQEYYCRLCSPLRVGTNHLLRRRLNPEGSRLKASGSRVVWKELLFLPSNKRLQSLLRLRTIL